MPAPKKWETELDDYLKPLGVCFSGETVREEDIHFAIKIDTVLNGEDPDWVSDWIMYRGYQATLMKLLAIALLCIGGSIVFFFPSGGGIFLACIYYIFTSFAWWSGSEIIYYHHIIRRENRDEAILNRLKKVMKTRKQRKSYYYTDPTNSH